MVFYAAVPSYFTSSHKRVYDDGMRSYPVDAGPSSYCYGGGPYDYDELGLADRFYIVVHAADHPLWDSCAQSQLDVVAELVDIKADGDYYNTKKLVKDLGLPIQKIDACKNGCMLYWKESVRFGRLYSSRATAEHMMWKYFDRMYSNLVEELRNVRLGLCTYNFATHSQYGRTYSCWSVSITPYNLPPGMCMSSEYMFLTMVIPGFSNPKRLIYVYLEPLIK
ncbi:UNVERIFIED_CONTAM: hypothetical protein Scaly_3085900 [Sesamum calycinum]|uniref:Uncharacterized protein n=1 Tax=Sesamum calycinum TaxID=2727403 RepID=A0AAW2JQI5_9LAMI